MDLQKYFADIETKVKVAYSIAGEARSKGLDPFNVVEIPLASSLAGRVVGIVSTKYPQINDQKIVQFILDLEKQYGKLNFIIPLLIAENIAKQKFCKFMNKLEGIDAGIRLGMAYITLGVVSSPLEGFTQLNLKKTRDGKDYLAAYFSGPIRSAGGTAAAFTVILIDYMRKIFNYAKYDPTDDEVKRSIVEIQDYHEQVTNLQYLPTYKEIETIAKGLPIQVTGEPSEKREVTAYKNLERIETNRMRNGFCLVMAEGIALKALKLYKILSKLKDQGINLFDDFSFIKKLTKKSKDKKGDTSDKVEPNFKYLKDLAAGRPILAHPSASGGFRLRYGRARNTGYSAQAIHPVAMLLTGEFIGTGTQLKVERPGKSTVIAVCDSIEGPIVKLNNGSVLRLNNLDVFKSIKSEIQEILYLGDVLINYGDFYDRNHLLMPAGYVSEFWFSELKNKIEKIKQQNDDVALVKQAGELINKLKHKPNINYKQIEQITKQYNLPLHPSYIFFWSQIDIEQLNFLCNWLKQAKIDKNVNILLPYNTSKRKDYENAKRALEILGVEHSVVADSVLIKPAESKALLLNLGINFEDFSSYNFDFALQELNKELMQKFQSKMDTILNNIKFIKKTDLAMNELRNKLASELKSNVDPEVIDYLVQNDSLLLINLNSSYVIMDKAGTFIGSRMGRPEKAKERKLTGHPNVLFPVGEQGGRQRSFDSALQNGFIKADFPLYFCEKCNKETIYKICENCGEETRQLYYCPTCQKKLSNKFCEVHGDIARSYTTRRIDARYFWNNALQKLNLTKQQLPSLIKGVRGTSSANHTPEHLAKGLLRAMYNLHVNKDGTIRYDATEMPLTHFKPKEVGTSIEKLRELGYVRDKDGKPLTDEDQVVEIMPQDIILPACPETIDEKADEFFFNVSRFLDELLVRFYGLKPFFELKSKQDLVGHLFVCMAPHTSAGVVTRLIGFSKTQGLLASPFVHAAMRRDCDGDEASTTLLLDTILNFSKAYLPSHRGSTQDAPLVLNSRIRAGEVDDMVFNIDIASAYPLEFYYATLGYKPPSTVEIKQIKDMLNEPFKVFRNIGFTHDVSDINSGVRMSTYKKVDNMKELVRRQMELAVKLRSVDQTDVARLIIERHFIKDIKGNLRRFSQQQFRCVKCNTKYRRPPLTGSCLKCGGRIIFTVSEGNIVKYLEPALEIAEKYNVPVYVKQCLSVLKESIESIFGKEKEKQSNLNGWFK